MAEAGNVASGLGLPGEASQWPLKRYGRFMLLDTRESPGPSSEGATASSPSWKVFESSEEAGALVLTIVVSGHFFISQGQTLLSKSRMFRVQFSGESQEEALERCCSCVQTLAQYVTVQAPDSMVQQLQQSPGPLGAGESQGKDLLQQGVRPPGHSHSSQQQVCVAAGTGAPEGRTSVMHLAQTILASEKLPSVYEQSSWGAEELGPFLRLCLMDQNFPAFVEEVEKELKKITQS
ncbi:meiotic recombination protein REC114 isoform X3 [Arvicola amphibius]|uniref:meiotic recombination protein REC114 isoform X3 n=1 Tax=Arvicola amphibius TaxID=1047088 RepID=UPI0018E3F50B|nr:meiotic recombination protein REC114 isoform X3 [Arvicola amphibius]